jgi:ABC-2 type transport system permease protein
MKERFTMARALAIARKEVMHILRDPFTLAIAIGVPVLLVVFFGFVIDYNYRDIRIAVFDQDHTRESRQLTETFAASEYFIMRAPAAGAAAVREVESERSSGALIIDPKFGRRVASGQGAVAQVLVDGTDNLKSGVITGYLSGIMTAAVKKLTGTAAQNPIEIVTRFVYNPELNTQWFVVPGLIVIVTGLLSIFLTALTIAREWENGSMELLLSTPVLPLEVIVGKILPYVFLGLAGIVLVYVSSRFIFGVPFEGSYLLFVLSCLLFIGASLAQGLLISITTRQQQRAMQFSMLLGILPAMLLSGFVFPIESMPTFFRYLTAVLPPRWFMQIIRGIFLKDAGLVDLWLPFAVLLLMNIVLIAVAKKRFKRDIEP